MLKTQKIIFLSCLIIVSAVSLFWLTAHIFQAFPWHGLYQQADPDSLLFARLLEQSILRGQVMERDNYGCYPYRIQHGFGPFYLLFLTHCTGFFFTVFPECGLDPLMVAGSLPILFVWGTGLLIIATLCLVAGNSAIVLFCAFFLLPGLSAGMTGALLKLDYDFLISFFIWAWLLSCILFLEKRWSVMKIFGGILAALFIATWSGTPLFFFLLTGYGFFLWFFAEDRAENYLVFTYSTMIIGGTLNVLFILSSQGVVIDKISLTKYSFFQPFCVLIGGIFLLILQKLNEVKKKRTAALCILSIIIFILLTSFQEQISQSTGMLFQRDPVHSTITELQSVVNFDKLSVKGDVAAKLVEYFGWAIILLPMFAFCRLRDLPWSTACLLKFWLITGLCLTLHQVRFYRWLGIGAGLFTGLSVYNLWSFIREGLKNDQYRNWRLGAIFLPLMLSFLNQSFAIVSSHIALNEHQVESFNWIARNTPQTSGYYDDGNPEYSILSYWDEGNLIAYYTKRPTAVNNAMWGFKTMADIFSSTNEDEAFALCQEYGVRYIYISTHRVFENSSYGLWPFFKQMPKRPEYVLQHSEVPIVKEFGNWFYFWLLDNLALTPKGRFPAGGRFRVVYAAKAEDNILAPIVLFERVAGAKLAVNSDPGTEVAISLELKVSSQNLVYKVRKTADATGKTEFVLPYANNAHGGRVTTDPIYKLGLQREGLPVKASIIVTDQDIMQGLPVKTFQVKVGL